MSSLSGNYERLGITISPELRARIEDVRAGRPVERGARAAPHYVLRASSRKQRRSPSPREMQVLRLVAQGFTNEELARELGISVETIKTHVRSLLRRLHAETRAHAVGIAYESGLIVPGESRVAAD